MKNKYDFMLTEKVIIDGCDDIVAVVTAVEFRSTGCQIELAWIHNGVSYKEWIEDWRVGKWEE